MHLIDIIKTLIAKYWTSCNWLTIKHQIPITKCQINSITLSKQFQNPIGWLVGFMVFNAPFNNISVISWRSVLLVEETGVPGENHQPVASHCQTLLHNVVFLVLNRIRTHKISG